MGSNPTTATMKLRRAKVEGQVGEHYLFYCPGCKEMHRFQVGVANGPSWTFDGNMEKPTFSPSLLITSGHYVKGHLNGDSCWCTYNEEHPNDPAPFTCGICHLFLKEGKLEFLGDCTHDHAGKTVDLEEIKE